MLTEKELEQLLVEMVKSEGGEAYKFISPGRAGVPDRLIVLPNGKVGFVEVKSPKNKGQMRKIQIYEMRKLLGLGMKYYILNDPIQVPKILDDIAR